MAFVRKGDRTLEEEAELDKKTQEILENMATLDDLFGSKAKGPKVTNLKTVGEFVKGVVKEIATDAPVYEWDGQNNKMGFQKYWVDGKPKGVAESEAKAAGLNPVHQIMITVETNDGDVRIPVNSKQEREAFKQAIIDAGGSIDPGDIIGKKLTAREGNIKTHEFKVTKQGA
jgi:hypothetical protein